MKLGADIISIELAGEAFELRPSLRACLHLTRRHGLPSLLAAVQGFNITIIMDMLREAAIRPELLPAEIAAIGLGNVYYRLIGPLTKFVLAIAGHDPDNTATPAPGTGDPITPEELFTRLFNVATGWLGWAPEDAWNATPAEILAAKSGRTDLITDILKAVFGSSDNDKTSAHYTTDQLAKIEELGRDPTFDRKALHALKNKGSAA